MPVYDVNGNQLNTVYGVNGTALGQAYDIDGNPLIDDGSVNVMTFNICRWRDINANATIMNSIFNAYKPILFCGIQEAGSDGTMNYIGTQFQSGKAMECNVPNKTAILFNTSYTDYSDAVYTNQSAGEARGYQKCYVTVGGKRIAIFNTHLEPDIANTRIAQAMELLALMENENYCIAVGDFNFIATSVSDTEYTGLAQPFITAGYNMANWTQETGLVNTWFSGSTVAGSETKYPTDNIITSSNITINSITYDQRKIDANTGQWIDHIPIVVNLTVT